MRHRLLPIAVLALFTAGGALAEPVQVEYFDLPPYTYLQNGRPAGQALVLARSLIEGLDIAIRTELVPIRRLNFEAAHSPIVVAAIIRTPQRDELYQWIGRLCTDAFVMVNRAPAPLVDSLDEARRLKKIAVVTGASNETYLREQGFTNLDAASSIELEVRRLAEGHDDAWFAPRKGALHAWKAAGYDPVMLQFGAPILPTATWMAASKSVPFETVEILRARFAEKVRDGTVAAITGCQD